MGQNQVHRINQSRNSFLSSHSGHTCSCGGCEGKKRGSCSFIAAIMSGLLMIALERGSKKASSKACKFMSSIVKCIIDPSVNFNSCARMKDEFQTLLNVSLCLF